MQHEKKSRHKPIKSCLECNRRKQKCNRQKPCNHCQGRGVEHLCVYSPFQTRRGSSQSVRRGRSGQPKRRRKTPLAGAGEEQHTPTTISSSDSDSDELEMDGLEALRNFPLMTAAKNGIFSSRSRSRLRNSWPERPVADFLVSIFLQEINRTYEMIYPPSFHSRYNEWWAFQENLEGILEGGMSDEDVDFGILILRLCLLSVQCLPHSRYPTSRILEVSLDHLEECFYSMANEIEKTQPSERKPTLVTVQQRFYHVCYLRNYARIRECWAALSVTVKDAHEMGLHLKDPGVPLSNMSMELRRRTFWNLYVVDRFMCNFFGYWPLIPEGYFDIDPPRDSLRTITIRPYILTSFTDRIFYIKVARYLTAFTSPPSWNTDQYNPVLVSEFAQRFKEVVVDQLPPAYWLETPDTRWDTAEPTLVPKRETLHLFIYSANASLYRAFADPCNNLHLGDNTKSRYGDEEGGTCEEMFLFPILLVEALACLGVCLLAIQGDTQRLSNAGIQFSPDADLRYSYATFFDAFGLLSRQAPQYGIAKRGVSMLESLHDALHSSSTSPSLFRIEEYRNAAIGHETPAAVCFHLEQALMAMHSQGNGEVADRVFSPLPEWLTTFFDLPGRCWLFRDQSAFGDLLK